MEPNTDVLVIKMTSNGTVIWQNCFGSPDWELMSGGSSRVSVRLQQLIGTFKTDDLQVGW